MEGKNIKVYGTLINQTQNTDSSMCDSQHNDLIAVAYQLYDERFTPKKGSGSNGAVINIDKYQDIINKRLTALSYDPNGDLTSLYSNLYVGGDTNIGGNIHVDGTSTFDGPAVFNNNVNITGNINMNIGLNDLNDVVLSTMAIGQVLRYDGNKWVNSKLSLDDLQMPNASAGQVLKFNGTNWVADTDNDTNNIDQILPAASEGQVLKYTNGHWVPGTDQTGSSGSSTLEDLTDVDVTGKTNGNVLTYDSNSGKWKASTTNTNVTSMRVTGDWIIDNYSGSGYQNVLYTCVYSMPVADAQKVLSAVVWFKAKYVANTTDNSNQSLQWYRSDCSYGDNFIINSITGRVIDEKWYATHSKTIADGNELYWIVDSNTPPIFLFMISNEQ